MSAALGFFLSCEASAISGFAAKFFLKILRDVIANMERALSPTRQSLISSYSAMTLRFLL